MKNNVVVIFGGKSTEHEISVLSGLEVLHNLDRKKYEIIPIYITKKGEWFTGEKLFDIETYKKFNTKKLKEVIILPNSNFLFIKKIFGYKKYKKIDSAFIIMHGKNGEDGTLQGVLELANIPYSSSNVEASSLGINKLLQKNIFENIMLPVIPYTYLTYDEYLKLNKKPKLDKLVYPVIVKPNKLGSSIGITVCKKQKDFLNALDLAFKFDDVVIIEQYIKNLKEVNISVMGYKDDVKLSELEQPITKNEFLDFENKYMNGSKNTKLGSKTFKGSKNEINGLENLSRIIPAKIDNKTKQKIEEYATTIFKYLNCKGVVRIDFILDKDDNIFVNEINTIPGSLAFYLWKNKNINFSRELDYLFDISIRDWKDKQEKLLTFENHILK